MKKLLQLSSQFLVCHIVQSCLLNLILMTYLFSSKILFCCYRSKSKTLKTCLNKSWQSLILSLLHHHISNIHHDWHHKTILHKITHLQIMHELLFRHHHHQMLNSHETEHNNRIVIIMSVDFAMSEIIIAEFVHIFYI